MSSRFAQSDPEVDTVAMMSHETSARRSLAGRVMRWSVLGAGALLLAGCAKNAPQDTFQPAGPNAKKIDDLQRPVFYLAGLVGVAVIVIVGYVMWRYKDRGQEMPPQGHGKPVVELLSIGISGALLAGISVFTVSTVMDLAKTSDTQCVVVVTGQQWWWEYVYPVQDGCATGGIKTPIVTSGEMAIPTGTKVLAQIQSNDVMHSFWIPKLNGKRDAVPGRTHTLRLEADYPGIFAGQCTEFCGLSHARMRMHVAALNQTDFDSWVANQEKPYETPTGEALLGQATFNANCSRCHQVNGLTDGNGVPVVSQPDLYVVAGNAPNLTALMTRHTFAGATFDLLTPACRERLFHAKAEEFGALYLQGVTRECLNEKDLREWIRNAPSKKPMYASASEMATLNGKSRGMPNLGLNDDQISEIIDYLLTRK